MTTLRGVYLAVLLARFSRYSSCIQFFAQGSRRAIGSV